MITDTFEMQFGKIHQ